jgi:hypothetical protein
MTIEKNIERIADALESMAINIAIISVAVEGDDEPEMPAAPKKKAPAKKAAKAKNQVQVGTDDEADDVTKEEVRAKLTEVQKATSPAQAKSILKAEGASTIGNLPLAKYQRVIDACDKVLAEQ